MTFLRPINRFTDARGGGGAGVDASHQDVLHYHVQPPRPPPPRSCVDFNWRPPDNCAIKQLA